MSCPLFDDVTLCKHIKTEETAFIMFNSFSCTKKQASLEINIVFAQIAISITSLRSDIGFLCDEMGKIWRMVIRKNIMLVA